MKEQKCRIVYTFYLFFLFHLHIFLVHGKKENVSIYNYQQI